jgi:hypothetical protein
MKIGTFALVPVLGILCACSSYSVKYDFDPHASFAAYKTYDWYAASAKAQGKSDGVANPIMDRRVRRIVEREFAARGYKLQEAGDPDFLLTYYPVYRNRLVQTYTGMGPGWGYGWGRPWGYGPALGFAEVQAYREGSIVLEVVDNKSNQLVWQAVADGALTAIEDPQDAEEQVTDAVKKMLEKFPPPIAR